MNDYLKMGIWVVLIGAAFAFLWTKGYLKQFTHYVRQTREELKKCTWPTWDELKGSTVIVAIAIVLLGSYTVIVDQVLFRLFMFFKL